MSNLGQQSCSACSADAPQVTDAEKQTLLKDVPEWQLIVQDGEEQLQRVFTFKNFVQAQAFTNKVADLAEEEGEQDGRGLGGDHRQAEGVHRPDQGLEGARVSLTGANYNRDGELD